MTVWDLERGKTGYEHFGNHSGRILYEIVSIGGCALYLKMKERKHKGGQNTAGDDFSTGGQSMTWPVVGASLALSLLVL